MKLVSFNRIRESFLPSFSMDDADLQESPTRLICLTFSTGLNNYIESITGSAARKVASLCCSKQFFSPKSLLQLYKTNTRSRTEYCSHIWSAASGMYLDFLKEEIAISLVLTQHPEFRHFPTTTTYLPYAYSVNTFKAIILGNFSL